MHPYFSYPRDSLGTECSEGAYHPDESIPQPAEVVCRRAATDDVGARLKVGCAPEDGVGYFMAEGDRLRAEGSAR